MAILFCNFPRAKLHIYSKLIGEIEREVQKMACCVVVACRVALRIDEFRVLMLCCVSCVACFVGVRGVCVVCCACWVACALRVSVACASYALRVKYV